MAKYHISPTTGRPNLCTANKRPCPVGGADDHYPTKEAARQGYENNMHAQTLAVAVSKKVPGGADVDELAKKLKQQYDRPDLQVGSSEKEQLQIDSGVIMDNIIMLIDERNQLMKDAVTKGFDKTLEEAKGIERRLKDFQEIQGEIDERLRTIAKKEAEADRQAFQDRLRESMPAQYYSDKARVKEVMDKENARPWRGAEEHFSLNSGRLNPMDYSGSGDEFYDPAHDSLVILAEADGKSPRAIASSGNMYRDPEEQLGRRAIQTKQNTSYRGGRDTQRMNLRVLGYVAPGGERHGWIPNKQIAFFVYK